MYQRIRDLREDRDLLQKDVAAYLKCTQVCYSNYETGKRDIPTEVLIQLAGLYHIACCTEDQVLRHICIVSQQLLSIFRQAVSAARCQVLDNIFHKFLF